MRRHIRDAIADAIGPRLRDTYKAKTNQSPLPPRIQRALEELQGASFDSARDDESAPNAGERPKLR